MTSPNPVRILVGDDASLREPLTQHLKSAGYVVLDARTGEEALEIAHREKPDLCIFNIQLTSMDGYKICRKLKADEATRSIRVLLCSERRGKEDVLEAIRSGADDFLVRPFGREHLLNRVKVALGRPRTPAPLPAGNWDRRVAQRAETKWTVSWSAPLSEGYGVTYKSRVLDISETGLALEFQRCTTCTGYEQGTVHAKCLFAPYALKLPGTAVLELILALSSEVVLEVEGQIAHVFQPPEWPFTEKVGIRFKSLPPEAAAVIQKWVSGDLRF